MQRNTATIGIIGGSGLYEMEGLSDVESIDIDTPFGRPSDAITVGTLEETRVAFLPRHGQGHRFNPTHIPVQANIYALKTLGVDVGWIEPVSLKLAVGSVNSESLPACPR